MPVRAELDAPTGQWRARAADGTWIPCPEPGNGTEGPATLMIRQEHLRLLSAAEGEDVSVPARVTAVAYRGQSARVAVEALGQRLQLAVEPGARIGAGDQVRVGWAFADSRLIR